MTISGSPIIECTIIYCSNVTPKSTLFWTFNITIMGPNSIWPPTKDWIWFWTTSISIIEIGSDERCIWSSSLICEKYIYIMIQNPTWNILRRVKFTFLYVQSNLITPCSCWVSSMLKITIATIIMNVHKEVTFIIMITLKETFPNCWPMFNFVCPMC